MHVSNVSVSRRIRAGVGVAVLALLAAACQPGWVNPFVGTGDGSGTTPGVTEAANFTVSLQQPTSVVAIPGGGFYVYDASACAIYRVMNEASTLYAGTPNSCGFSGDGGPATDAQLATISGGSFSQTKNVLALGPDGTLYFAGYDPIAAGGMIRRITPDGMITSSDSIASPTGGGFSGVTVAPDGTVFASGVAFAGNGSIVRLEADGALTTVYTATHNVVASLAAVSSSELVFAVHDVFDGATVSLDRLDLTTNTVTATGVLINANIGDAVAVAAAGDGTVYLGADAAAGASITADGVTSTNQVVRLRPDGTATPIAGTGEADPGTARQYGIGLSLALSPAGLAVTPHGGLLISSGHVVYRLDRPATVGATPVTVPSSTTAPTG